MFKKMLPMPVTVITTVDSAGIVNAAPYGCVMPILRPLDLIAIATALPRDTLRNIRETGEFVVNVIGRPGFQEAMQTARDYPPEVNELEATGLESVASKKVAPPRIKDSIGWIEAVRLEEILRDSYALIIGRVLCAETNDKYVDGDDSEELPAVMIMQKFRGISDIILGDPKETLKLFLPQSPT